MPIVISYTDVEALGTLAHRAGYDQAYAQGIRQNRAEDYRNRALDQQGDIQRENLEARRQVSQFTEEGRNRRHDEALSAAEYGRQQRLQEQLFAMQGRAGLEEQRQENREGLEDRRQAGRLERIAVEVGYGKYSEKSKSAATLDRGGLPSLEYAKDEVSKYHHLIPEGRVAGSAAFTAERFGQTIQEARDISRLPTDEIRRILDARPNDKLAPYMAAILSARGGMQGLSSPVPSADQGLGYDQGLGVGQGLAPDPILGGLSDQELYNRFQRMPAGM